MFLPANKIQPKSTGLLARYSQFIPGRPNHIILKLNETYLSRCLIGILPRHQSGTTELHEKQAHAYRVNL